MCRMLEGGEDPLYIARRLIRFASEDIGMADSHALPLAGVCLPGMSFPGMPECDRPSDSCSGVSVHGAEIQRPYRACEAVRRM